MLKKIANWISRKRKERLEALMFERQVVVSFDDEGISSTYPDGTVQTIAWHEINCVAIETNDSGPWGADVWWFLEGSDKRCVYPQGATGDPEALDEYPKRLPEFRERAVRLLLEHRDEYQSEAAALTAIAGKLGCSPDSLRVWARQVQRDGGERPGQTTAEKLRIKELERENRELRQANEILKKASAYFAQAELDRPFRK